MCKNYEDNAGRRIVYLESRKLGQTVSGVVPGSSGKAVIAKSG